MSQVTFIVKLHISILLTLVMLIYYIFMTALTRILTSVIVNNYITHEYDTIINSDKQQSKDGHNIMIVAFV